jgi:hypothetical protein
MFVPIAYVRCSRAQRTTATIPSSIMLDHQIGKKLLKAALAIFVFIIIYIASFFILLKAHLFGSHFMQASGLFVYFPMIKLSAQPINVDTDNLDKLGISGSLLRISPSDHGPIVTITHNDGIQSFNAVVDSETAKNWEYYIGKSVKVSFTRRYSIGNGGAFYYVKVASLALE